MSRHLYWHLKKVANPQWRAPGGGVHTFVSHLGKLEGPMDGKVSENVVKIKKIFPGKEEKITI